MEGHAASIFRVEARMVKKYVYIYTVYIYIYPRCREDDHTGPRVRDEKTQYGINKSRLLRSPLCLCVSLNAARQRLGEHLRAAIVELLDMVCSVLFMSCQIFAI